MKKNILYLPIIYRQILLMKLLFTILIIYLAYKVLFKPKSVNPPHKNERIKNNEKDGSKGEYIDYEEVD